MSQLLWHGTSVLWTATWPQPIYYEDINVEYLVRLIEVSTTKKGRKTASIIHCCESFPFFFSASTEAPRQSRYGWICTFATICNTTVYVYCSHGMIDQQRNKPCLAVLSPLNARQRQTNETHCVYISNIGNQMLRTSILYVSKNINTRNAIQWFWNLRSKQNS